MATRPHVLTTMKALNRKLKGARTYIVAVIAIAYFIGADLGWYPLNEAVIGILGSLGVAFLRAGVGKR